jgi:hypothetical protein
MRAVLLLLALLAGSLAGCTTPAGPGPGRPPPPPQALEAAAPWWDVGDSYTVRLERAGAQPTTWRMVNFWNDTDTAHFWLGVSDRQQAMDMALFDTNPFLGRIHHAILTPHERGMHASMYNFPLSDGKRWTGFFFDRNWSFEVRERSLGTVVGPDQGFEVEGRSRDGGHERIVYDYSPKLRWFNKLEEFDGSGARILLAEVTDHQKGATGTFVFLRGVDFHQGPQLAGTHEESFRIQEEVSSLAFYVRARATGPVEIQLLDPSGAVRQRASAPTGGEATLFREVSPVQQGEWRIRYVATGAIQGEVSATGLIETSRTL